MTGIELTAWRFLRKASLVLCPILCGISLFELFLAPRDDLIAADKLIADHLPHFVRWLYSDAVSHSYGRLALGSFAWIIAILASYWGRPLAKLPPAPINVPPRWGLLMFAYLSPPAERDAVVGDAEEMFHSDVERFGVRHARMLLLCDVARSSIHLIGRALRKSIVWAFAYLYSTPSAK